MVTYGRWLQFSLGYVTFNGGPTKMLTFPNIVMSISFTDVKLIAGFTLISINYVGTKGFWNSVLKVKAVA